MSSSWSPAFATAVHAALVRRCPPAEGGAALAELSQALVDALERGELDLPLTPDRVAVVQASGWLEGDDSPLLQRGERIGWRRWLEAMEGVVEQLLERQPPSLPTPQEAPEPPSTLNLEQQAAVLAMDGAAVVLLSGGPGTGKTSTVVELLRRASQRHPTLRIGLAAPTGKAARRLGDAVRPGLNELPCFTLHRWLEAAGDGFRRHRQRPLELDLLVIDEMSMVDLELMSALLEALPDACRLLLVGDPAQLPPVGSGAVWQRLQDPAVRERFGSAAVHLVHTYRNRGALAALATTLRQQGIEAFRRDLEQLPATANVQHQRASLRRLPPSVRDGWRDRHQRLSALATGLVEMPESELNDAAGQLLLELENDLVLCPRRRGPWSLEDVHRSLLGGGGWMDPLHWPEGVPVICGGNQPELGLANGDLGVKLGSGEQSRVLFRVMAADGQPQIRRLHPARLTSLEPALALTIHRAQGSEADRVTVLWPPLQEDNIAYDSCLLYTAITRARGSLDLITAVDR